MSSTIEPIVQEEKQSPETTYDSSVSSGPKLESDAKSQECLDLFSFVLVF